MIGAIGHAAIPNCEYIKLNMHRKSSSGKAKNSSRKYLFGYNINKELSEKKSIFFGWCVCVCVCVLSTVLSAHSMVAFIPSAFWGGVKITLPEFMYMYM